ncbi:hypothetical protein M2475_002169 [Breznakia sp. PF5-3]|nr:MULTISPECIES: hypothetical protein [unclassified Breznakia]MDF9825783.1 hypothetical protein [Breznakia sp. PM6-1]MDF9836588.1 hypothetical protein [Breznakia sp. PF5-3]MDF9838836.1 hypothetical protein [Breznakia sp. PFB2-8]MDF9860851.1 hypothetical protein [Breznakia sp. PH5-24]
MIDFDTPVMRFVLDRGLKFILAFLFFAFIHFVFLKDKKKPKDKDTSK